jgi:hypothetical protein
MSIIKKIIGNTFNKSIIQYAPLWTKAPDSSRTRATQAKWFYKEKEIFTTNPHPRYNEESIIYTFNERMDYVNLEQKLMKALSKLTTQISNTNDKS